MLCLTPITSVREVQDESYSKRSIHDRTVMPRRGPGIHQRPVAGTSSWCREKTCLAFKEHAALSKDGVHPQDRWAMPSSPASSYPYPQGGGLKEGPRAPETGPASLVIKPSQSGVPRGAECGRLASAASMALR